MRGLSQATYEGKQDRMEVTGGLLPSPQTPKIPHETYSKFHSPFTILFPSLGDERGWLRDSSLIYSRLHNNRE